MSHRMYLKPNLIIEPLVNQWYAWSYLISPATAAMYIANSHIPIMESFIAAPQVHEDALKNPAMLGGPFINYDGSKVGEIQELLTQTKTEAAELLKIAQAIPDLEKILTEHHHGESLEPVYAKIPPILRGFVELVQDSHNHPSIRWIEGLLYRSKYYRTEYQSLNLFLGNPDQRSFVLSTPRLRDRHNFHLVIPFADKRLDTLFQLRYHPLPITEIRDIFSDLFPYTSTTDSQAEQLFFSFLTTTPPTLSPKYEGEQIRVRYFGHACVLVETQNVTILCDPLVSYPHASGISRYSYTDLPEIIDYVLITHNHQDHVMLETLLQLRHKIQTVIVPKSNKGVLIDPSLKLMLQQIGFSDVREVDDLEIIDIPEGYIAALPFLGEHGDLNIGAKAAFLVNIKGRSLLCAADSNNIDNQLYSHIHQIFGDLDILFIGMECDGAPYNWAYGALLTEQVPRKIAQTRRLDGSNSQRAIDLVNQLNPQQVYVYAMGQEPWLTFITSIIYTLDSRPILESDKLVNYCRSRGITSKRLFGWEEIFLEPGTVSSSGEISPSKSLKTISVATPEETNHHPAMKPSVADFLIELQRLDIRVWLEGDSQEPKLKCNAPKGVLTSEFKEKLQKYKPDIINFLLHSSQSQVSINWEEEAVLDESISSAVTEITTNPQHILLTGATGFVGAFLLKELLQKTPAEIYCLIRAENIDTAWKRIQTILQSYQLWEPSLIHRIIPIVGNLSQPLLGLSPSQFQNLAQKIDIIYHNGARVNHTDPYKRLKPSNVLGTQEILRLASSSQLKPVHFVSTISVFGNSQLVTSEAANLVLEDDNLDDYAIPPAGYAQSKRIAEKLIMEARNRGIPANIYRIGAISGDSKTGVFNPNDFLYKSLLGYIQMGTIPDGTLPLRLLPVDYVSQAIFTLSTQSQNQSFHLVQSQPTSSDLILEELQKMGYQITKIPYDQWRNQLLEIASNSPDHILYPLVSLFPRQRPENNSNLVPLEFSDRNTQKILQGVLAPPPIDGHLIQTYLNYLIQTGHIKPPVKI